MSMKRLGTVVVALALSLGVASAEELRHREGGFILELPARWVVEETEGGRLQLGPSDGHLLVDVWVHRADDWTTLDQALAGLRGELDDTLTEPAFDVARAERITVGGMEAALVSGTARWEGDDVAFRAAVIMARRPVLFLSFGHPDGYDQAAERELRDFITAVRRAP